MKESYVLGRVGKCHPRMRSRKEKPGAPPSWIEPTEAARYIDTDQSGMDVDNLLGFFFLRCRIDPLNLSGRQP